VLLLNLFNGKINEKNTMNQNTADALFTSFVYSQFKKVFKQALMLDKNFTGIDNEKHVISYLRNVTVYPFKSYCVHPWFFGGVRVAHRLSILCCVCYVLFTFVHCLVPIVVFVIC